MQKIKLSFVITARNDNYGGNLISRTMTSIRVLTFLVNKYKIPSEIVLVEYNPVLNKKYFINELTIPKNPFLSIRGIIVPSEFHNKVRKNNIPLLEYIAKNIGIRRSYGKYIIATNPDIIISESLIKFISENKLNPHCFYRTNRSDISIKKFDETMPEEIILEKCKKNVVKIFYNTRTNYISYLEWINRVIHGRKIKDLYFCPLLNYFNSPCKNKIHENAAGDFLMAYKNVWEAAHGYEETPNNLYHDGLILYVLEALGHKQQVLSQPIYHINHDIGRAGRPGIEFKYFRKKTTEMQKTKIPNITNNTNWGFPKINFNEIFLTPKN